MRRLGTWQFGIFGWLFSAFGAVALMLAVTGVYGCGLCGVAATQEIGLRVALGAAARRHRLIVGQGSASPRQESPSACRGVRRNPGLASLLYNVTATDPLTFVGASLFLMVLAAFASYVPTRRAAAVDPLIALRAE